VIVTPPHRAREPRVAAPAARRPAPPAATDDGEAAVAAQRAQFDFVLEERAELAREFNELRLLEMEQLKQDDDIVKKWIAMI